MRRVWRRCCDFSACFHMLRRSGEFGLILKLKLLLKFADYILMQSTVSSNLPDR